MSRDFAIAPCLSLVVITGNEERHIVDCLRSAFGLPGLDEIVLVDDFSRDATLVRAHAAVQAAGHPAPQLRVFQRHYDGQAGQTNFALDRARGAWLLLLDCDERLTRELRDEIAAFLTAPTNGVAAVHFPRKNVVFGRWLRHGGNYPDYNHPRLVRRGSARFETDRTVHCRMRVDGATTHFESPLLHHSYPSIEVYLTKFNRYTTAEAAQMAAAGRRFSAARMGIESLGHLVQRGLLKSAWRDGAPGLIYLGLGFAYDLVRHLKLRELSRKSPAAAGVRDTAPPIEAEAIAELFS